MAGKRIVTWQIHFLLNSDWLIKGVTQQGFFDVTPLEDALGRPYIPASTIKGAIRHEFRKLCSIFPAISKYEGKIFGFGGNQPGQLYFEDALLQNDVPRLARSRIKIDRKRKVVSDAALLTEQVVSAGARLKSEGMMYVQDNLKEEIAAIVALSILNLKQIGSGRSIGRGIVDFAYCDGQAVASGKSTVQVYFDQEVWAKDDFEQYLSHRVPIWERGEI